MMHVIKRLGAGLPWITLLLLTLASVLILESGQAVTQAAAPVGVRAPDSQAAGANQVSLGLEKAAWPSQVVNGDLVTYTVTVSNNGGITGTVDAVIDTLDPGLTFAGMLAGSDVITPPGEISNTLTWSGPFTLPAGSALTLLYQAQTPPVHDWVRLCNSVEISTTATAPAAAGACVDVRPEFFHRYLPYVAMDFMYAQLDVTKTAWPTSFMADPAAEVVYTATVANVGDTTGSLLAVSDTLPAGFTFLGMEPGSDVTADPAGTSGTITWSGNWPMPPGSQMDVAYRVRPSEVPGEYANSVTVVAQDAGTPETPAVATVVVEPAFLLQDDFNDPGVGISRWTPFLNYGRQAEGQWYWGPNGGYNGTGGLTMDRFAVEGKDAHDGLIMYLADGAEGWTDYRMEAKVNFRTDGHPSGIWVRGQWEPSETSGQWVTGYYCMIGGGTTADTHYVRLLQLQTLEDCWGPPCPSSPEYIPGREVNLYHFSNPHRLAEVQGQGTLERYQWHTIKVEVRGANIKIWLNGNLYIDFTDPKEPFLTGTVGFKTYKADTVTFDDVVITPLSD
jgi:uncharacterized repeat protein (TIGR01451 family)